MSKPRRWVRKVAHAIKKQRRRRRPKVPVYPVVVRGEVSPDFLVRMREKGVEVVHSPNATTA